jgi:uncharacterized membrane protein YeaQ/YmgE (transglycosylase-associated protein family)
MGGLLWTILIGLVAGALAKLIMPGKDPGGIVVTILLGIGGALLATILGRLTGWYAPDRGAGFVAATLGAVVILFIYRLVKMQQAASKG